jgi:hypothetical protein
MIDQFPNMMRVRQVAKAPKEEDCKAAMARELNSLDLSSMISKGATIALAVGSRGIAHIDKMVRWTVSHLQAAGANVFIFPAMGSHGGGTAEGQIEVLASLGVTEPNIGAPIRATMDTVEIGRSRFGFPVLVDAYAAEADGIVMINRIKPHTDFQGPIESGLTKMMAIGMGKHRGCVEVHRQTVQYGYRDVIPAVGRTILEKLPILFGVGVLENAYDETALIRAIPAKQLPDDEAQLLKKAKEWMARLPVDQLDVLVVDEMGKNVSGTGMDTNVIGRVMFIGEPEPERPFITRIVVLNLTQASHGNAIGVGMADFTTQRLINQMDLKATMTNAIAAMTPEKGRLPIALENDRQAVAAALATIGPVSVHDARVIHIKNTLELGAMEVSTALGNEISETDGWVVEENVGPLGFDSRNRIHPVVFS